MQISNLPDGMEQLPDAELLACIIAQMLYEGDDACLSGADSIVVSIQDVSLMLCDVLRASRLKVAVTPATSDAVNRLNADLVIYRATNRV